MIVAPKPRKGEGEQNSAYRAAATLFEIPKPKAQNPNPNYNFRMLRRIVLLVLAIAMATAFGIAQVPQGPQSEGAIQNRPGANRKPEFPPPSILDYKPRSTLVVPQHPVPKAKYPVIDFHSHQPAPITPDAFDKVVASMDPLNLKVLVNASGVSGQRLVQAMEALRKSPHKDLMVQFTTINFNNIGPGSGQKLAQQLEADIKAGALGVGEINKGFGINVRKADGSRLHLDDPELDPVWQTAARLNIPVFIHTADPEEFFEPVDSRIERWLELALYPDRRYPVPPNPSFEELMGELDRLFKRNPKTTFVAAHLGWHANNLARL